MADRGLPPVSIRPRDGRFGAGPSLIRPEQLAAMARAPQWGTSHRQTPVIDLVKSVQKGLSDLFTLPDGYEIALGNGGSTAFWAAAACSLIRESAHLATFGEFGAKFAADVASSPWLTATTASAPVGVLALANQLTPGADVYAYPQNETSTGVASPLYTAPDPDALTLVDATSIAGASEVDFSLVDAYYFAPQKCFGSDAGLWLAVLSPAAQARAAELSGPPGRPNFGFLNLDAAIKASRKGQTVNTPAIGTLLLLDEQIKWMQENGGLAAMARKSAAGASLVHEWASNRDYAQLFVEEPAWRSPVITTVDLDEDLPVATIAAELRRAGIVDIEGYRGLGRNQLRIASFPSIETEDIEALLNCLDWVIGR